MSAWCWVVDSSPTPGAAADNNFGMGFGVAIPFVNHLGFELRLFAGGLSELAYAPKPEHLNSFDVTHGGALMTLLDVTMAAAARSVQSDMGVVTIEMKTTFMQPARGPLTGKGRLMHRTATMAFVEATVFDPQGRACAHATGTFKYVIETERRLYLANEVDLKRVDTSTDFYFELEMHDVWVWDIYRTDRFVKSVRVLSFKDVNIEELSGKAFELPKTFTPGQ